MEILGNNQIVLNIVLTVVAIMAISCLKWYTMHLVKKKKQDPNKEFMSKRVVSSVYIAITFLAVLIIWYDSSQYIVAFIGLFSAGMAIAMKDILLNVIGGLYILWASPFKVGDRIETAGQVGDVIDIRMMQFSMLEIGNRIAGEQSTGRMIHIPNMHIFNFPLANYEKGFRFIWNEMMIPLERDCNWEKAKEVIYHLIEENSKEDIEAAGRQIDDAGKKYMIYYNNLTPIIYTEYKEKQIILTVRYLCEPRKARMTEHILWEQILKKFEQLEDVKLG
ncbi:MAG: mechanosensitive ion channel family protein [Cellulosilyticaceae bacterium]